MCRLGNTEHLWVMHSGGKDYLVLAEKLLDRLRTNEPDVKVIRVYVWLR